MDLDLSIHTPCCCIGIDSLLDPKKLNHMFREPDNDPFEVFQGEDLILMAQMRDIHNMSIISTDLP